MGSAEVKLPTNTSATQSHSPGSRESSKHQVSSGAQTSRLKTRHLAAHETDDRGLSRPKIDDLIEITTDQHQRAQNSRRRKVQLPNHLRPSQPDSAQPRLRLPHASNEFGQQTRPHGALHAPLRSPCRVLASAIATDPQIDYLTGPGGTDYQLFRLGEIVREQGAPSRLRRPRQHRRPGCAVVTTGHATAVLRLTTTSASARRIPPAFRHPNLQLSKAPRPGSAPTWQLHPGTLQQGLSQVPTWLRTVPQLSQAADCHGIFAITCPFFTPGWTWPGRGKACRC
jgi:hypothetical protein